VSAHFLLVVVPGVVVLLRALGDIVDLGISHPCSAFDRWPEITVIDEQGLVRDRWYPQFR